MEHPVYQYLTNYVYTNYVKRLLTNTFIVIPNTHHSDLVVSKILPFIVSADKRKSMIDKWLVK